MFIKGPKPRDDPSKWMRDLRKEPPRVERQYVNLVLCRSVT
jgi:hypothetical protein